MRQISRLLPIALLAFSLSMPAYAGEHSRPGTISIQGIGEVSATPDMAYITSGVTTEGKTAREALDANTTAMTALIDVLKSAEIADKDIQTSNFSVQPQYVYSDQRSSAGYTKPPQIAGYQVSNSVTVRVRDLENLGTVLDQIVTVGANTINNVSFAVEDTDALYTEARKRAIKDAMAKAGLYTDAANVGLGRIVNISENGGIMPQVFDQRAKVAMMEMSASPVPVQAGELSYNISVSVQWELVQ